MYVLSRFENTITLAKNNIFDPVKLFCSSRSFQPQTTQNSISHFSSVLMFSWEVCEYGAMQTNECNLGNEINDHVS